MKVYLQLSNFFDPQYTPIIDSLWKIVNKAEIND